MSTLATRQATGMLQPRSSSIAISANVAPNLYRVLILAAVTALLLGPAVTALRLNPSSHRNQPRWQQLSRQSFIVSAAASLLVVATPSLAADDSPRSEFATSAGRKGCFTQSDPARTVVTCRGGLLNVTAATTDTTSLRLSGVSATENGVSTSAVKTPSRYAPPWTYLVETSNDRVAWNSLQQALVDVGGATIQTVTDTYLYATAPTVSPPGLDGVDDIEFLLRPLDKVVLYRSVSRTAVFVYPLTQPVSDQNSNRQRLDRIRERLGWDLYQ